MKKIAQIWQTNNGWLLEIAIGNSFDGFSVISSQTFQTKPDAKKAAKAAKAIRWNY